MEQARLMWVHRRFPDLLDAGRQVCVAVGNFDGVHLGHRAVLAHARKLAVTLGHELAVLTFEPHPRAVTTRAGAPPRLTSFRCKAGILADMGVERCIAWPFGRNLMQLTAEAFARDILVGRLRVGAVVAGQGFRFGHRRAGTMEELARLGRSLGFLTAAVDDVDVDGQPCTSSRIRTLLGDGDVGMAARLLARPHGMEGVVEMGDQRGRTLGYPTANLRPLAPRVVLPANGIYVVDATWANGGHRIGRPAVASLGVNPTFDGTERRLEVHVLDGEHELYGVRMEVSFIERLRPEARFTSTHALIEQMARDCDAARAVHVERRRRAAGDSLGPMSS